MLRISASTPQTAGTQIFFPHLTLFTEPITWDNSLDPHQSFIQNKI
uniref:Uncharacterized protein n=1 Tax=Nelumbo nucifera TaxID=4432 RepID=A0A822YRG2_NELNU|nr:TPA_asm: hypothetical protein HUJ06_012486 [Nelumbo nucifera]